MKALLQKISFIGISNVKVVQNESSKRIQIFNKVLFIGLFATLFQIVFVWPYIHEKSLIFTGLFLILFYCLYLNHKRRFGLSKWLYAISIHLTGILTTIFIGGAALYHLQAILVFCSFLLLFDLRKELPIILVSIPLAFLSILIGEYGWFDAPDFSDHYWTPIARFAIINMLFWIIPLFIVVLFRVNSSYEHQLEDALEAVSDKSEELEKKVSERTSELEDQKSLLLKKNEEKEVLLKEVHHRVKNNLQVITSLINLQLNINKKATTTDALKEIQGRIESMSRVHQIMYQKSDFKNIGMKDYANQIVENIDTIYGNEDYVFEVLIDDKLSLKLDDAIPLGLIINEIVSNFFKHGSKSERPKFQLQMIQEGELMKFIYSDNGPGYSESINCKDPNTLGLILIVNLTEQLDGQLSLRSEKGAVCEIHFPYLR